jgi:hypothetical protein
MDWDRERTAATLVFLEVLEALGAGVAAVLERVLGLAAFFLTGVVGVWDAAWELQHMNSNANAAPIRASIAILQFNKSFNEKGGWSIDDRPPW